MIATAVRSSQAPGVEEVGRDLGIPAIGRAPWGAHFCQFYRTKQDLLDILVPYFRNGLLANEFCMWVTSPPLEVDEAAEALRQAVIDFDRYLDSGQLEILPYTDWYLKDGVFDQQRVLNGWIAKLETALARGCDGMRLSGNTFWLEDDDWRDFTAYEAVINDVIGNYRMIGLCTYSLDRCGASEVIDVVANHQFGLIKRDDEWTLMELSERKRATEAVDQMNRALIQRTEELQVALADLNNFSHSVSHDLRAPLRAITSYGELLAGRCRERLDETSLRMLDRIRANASKMDRLITDILSYSLAQRAELAVTTLDIAALATEAYDGLAADSADRQVRLRIGVLPPARGDRVMIAQVLSNLMDNALKFTGGRSVAEIEVGASSMNGETVYFVRDNGVGFDPAYADKLFGVFERLHDGDEFDGTGLGLAITKQIITRHGGRVWAAGAPDAGTTIYFTLPS